MLAAALTPARCMAEDITAGTAGPITEATAEDMDTARRVCRSRSSPSATDKQKRPGRNRGVSHAGGSSFRSVVSAPDECFTARFGNVLMTHAARISDMARLGLGVSGPPDVPR